MNRPTARYLIYLFLISRVTLGVVGPEKVPSELKGTVTRYLLGPGGQIQGVLLDDGTSLWLPPPQKTPLVDAIKPGDPIIVDTAEPIGPKEETGRGMRVSSIRNARTGIEVDEQTTFFSGKAQELTAVGSIEQWLSDESGAPSGVVLSGGTQIKIPTDTVRVLRSAYSKSSKNKLSVSGEGVVTQFGTLIVAKDLKYGMTRLMGSDQAR